MLNRDRAGPLVAVIAVCVLAVSSNACSFAFVEGPPPNAEGLKTFDCTDSFAPPVLDTVLAVIDGALALFAYGLGRALGGSPTPVFWGFLAVGVGAPTASAIYGYSKVGSCRDVRRRTSAPSVAENEPTPADLYWIP